MIYFTEERVCVGVGGRCLPEQGGEVSGNAHLCPPTYITSVRLAWLVRCWLAVVLASLES